jgi:phage terminase Nu1 subunit (DNA packaging protein)
LRREKASSRTVHVSDPELNAEKIRLNRELADKAAILNAKARGELVPVESVRAEWSRTITDLRAALLAVPSRVASRVCLDRSTTAALDAELRAAMEAIATDGPQDFAGASPAPVSGGASR